MRTCIQLKNTMPAPLPEEFEGEDVRYAPELVEYFLREYTREGDLVLDPFLGFGTTVLVAERLGRVGYGVELEPQRLGYVRTQLQHPEKALLGDSTRLRSLPLPDFDFSITSPPFMGKHHRENPLTAYSALFEGPDGYQQYLHTIQDIYRQVGEKLKPSAHAVLEVSNLKHEDGTLTTLAWDIAAVVARELRFIGEVVVAWEGGYGYGYDHSYCLVFAASGS